ncbi:hypothetical protein IV417_10520 [Alphaproteobacteria bacterium KMM 3653]|uniref:ATP-grasp domain-containing protein n=1 Tax=Harenicola maris TaxID=2841044 RepID=A0AAP2G8T7_9RHOB|nr:hypothetical protein [Harenicola maris]
MSLQEGYGPAVWAADFAAYPEAVLDLMGGIVPLSLEQGDLEAIAGMGGGICEDTQALLAEELEGFAEGGAYIRLGLCSFKTGPAPMLPIFTAGQAVATMTQGNRRAAGVAQRMLEEGREGVLYLRPYLEIPRWCEYRMFIREGQVIGVSQYHTDQSYPQIHAQLDRIGQDLAVLAERLLPLLHMEACAADLAVDPLGKAPASLIELNPFVRRTGACLYSWQDGGDFDGGFRIL